MYIEKEEYLERVFNMRRWMMREEADACIFLSGSNMLYFSGTRLAGLLVIPREGDPLLLARYAFGDALAAEESPFSVESVKPFYGTRKEGVRRPDLAKRAREVLREMEFKKIRRLGVERGAGELRLKPIRKAFRARGRSLPFIDAGKEVEGLRGIKSEKEISLIAKAVEISKEAYESGIAELKPGVTEREIANRLEYEMKELGSPRPAFDSIVAFGVHTFNAHHLPTEKKLQRGDLVLFDWGASFGGYASDMTRTFAFGRPTEKTREIYEAVAVAQDGAIEVTKAGARVSEPDVAARRVLAKFGLLDEFVHTVGHGVGLDVHEKPRLFVESDGSLSENMVVTIEPGVYIDGWGGVRIEDSIVVKDGRPEILTAGVAKGITMPE